VKYAYPQNPTHAVSAIKRYDESSDSSTSQANLERAQDIAVVGETVPLIYCDRKDWGGELGVNGGVWLSPRLIQLGVRQTDLSMMYLLSQGQVSAIDRAKTFWGYSKIGDVDPDSEVCTAYEDVPACLDLDYDPGGSINWTEIINRPGPGPSQSGFTYSTQTDKAVKVTLNFSVDCQVTFSGAIVCGADWSNTWSEGWRPDSNRGSCTMGGDWLEKRKDYAESGASSGDYYRNKGFNVQVIDSYERNPRCTSDGISYNKTFLVTTAGMNKNAALYFTSGVLYNWSVVSETDGSVLQQGQQWLNHGSNTFEVDGLPPDKYQIQFSTAQFGWTGASSYCLLSPSENMPQQVAAYQNASMGYSSSAPGNGSLSGTSQATEVVYNTLDFPELPGGDQQIVGGLSDLTMFGIRGNVNLLRPEDGPDYFLQSHVFVEQGIQVERLMTGDVGASSMYPDLVYYLMQKAKVLQEDQIDKEALRLACKLCQTYGMHFNGVLQTTNSLSEWMTRTSPYFLLTPRQVDGKYGLWPVCPMNAAGELSRDAVQPAMVVTTDDIAVGSYSRQYMSPIDRRPICLVMVYRDQPVEAVGQTVTVEVRYPGTALSGPFESHDLTEHCCRPEQAVYAARYILAKRRFTTHTASFTLGRRAAQLKPGDIVRVDLALQTTDGEGITDSIFYQLESLQEGQGGQVIVEATHFPVDENGVSVVAKETHEGAVTIQ
jgi:hypothetical protein